MKIENRKNELKLLFLMVFISTVTFAQLGSDFIVVRGKVTSSTYNRVLHNVKVTIQNTTIGVRVNNEGMYMLNIPFDIAQDSISFSCTGYKTKNISIEEIKTELNVSLMPDIKLSSYTVLPIDVNDYVKSVLKKIEKNYPNEKNEMEGSIKHFLQKENEYIRFTEAIFSTFSKKYTKPSMTKIIDINTGSDTTEAVEIKGMSSDIFNYTRFNYDKDFLFSDISYYNFKIIGLITESNATLYKISFKPSKENKEDIKYNGNFIVDNNSLAILSFDYSKVNVNKAMKKFKQFRIDTTLSWENKYYEIDSLFIHEGDSIPKMGKVQKHKDSLVYIIEKIPIQTEVDIMKENISIEYKQVEGIWHLNYIKYYVDFNYIFGEAQKRIPCVSSNELFINKSSFNPEGKYDKEDVLNKAKELHEQIEEENDILWDNYNVILPHEFEKQIKKKLIKNYRGTDFY